MKRREFIKYLRQHGCRLVREGARVPEEEIGEE